METIFSKEAPTAVDGTSVEEQTLQVFENVKSVLSSKGLTLADVVKVNVYLTDMANFARMNSIYAEQFGMHKPARTTVAVAGLPLGAIVEIECIAEHKH